MSKKKSAVRGQGNQAGAPTEPRYTTVAVTRELRDMSLSCGKLLEDIIEAQTNSDCGFRAEAFENALRRVVDLRTLTADIADGMTEGVVS